MGLAPDFPNVPFLFRGAFSPQLEQIGKDVQHAAGPEAWVTGEAATRVICSDLGVCASALP